MEHGTHSLASDAQSLDTICTVLSDPRRRRVVDVLSGRESSISLSDLAAAVAPRETGTESDDGSTATADEVAVELHHVHLPKLDDRGVVDYRPEAKTVTPARTDEVARVLGVLDGSG